MSKKKLIRVLFLIILLQFGVYYPEFIKGDDRGLFVHRNRISEQHIDNNCSLNDIIEYAHSDNILSNKEITDIFNTHKAKILRREDNSDIKIFDFIFENDHYKEGQMFII